MKSFDELERLADYIVTERLAEAMREHLAFQARQRKPAPSIHVLARLMGSAARWTTAYIPKRRVRVSC
jgi:hypothetical protein